MAHRSWKVGCFAAIKEDEEDSLKLWSKSYLRGFIVSMLLKLDNPSKSEAIKTWEQ